MPLVAHPPEPDPPRLRTKQRLVYRTLVNAFADPRPVPALPVERVPDRPPSYILALFVLPLRCIRVLDDVYDRLVLDVPSVNRLDAMPLR